MSSLKSIKDPGVTDVIYRKNQPDKKFHPSPEAWEDELLYFFLPDRFSDGNEHDPSENNNAPTPRFEPHDRDCALRDHDSKEKWLEAGKNWVGGTLKGATTKLGYLKRMGVTALWVGPIFKQIASLDTYHGYAIQDFLDVDPRFGTRDDLKNFVQAAHREGIYVLLDIVLNHVGNVFMYKAPNAFYTGTEHGVKGFWSASRDPSNLIPFKPVDEDQDPDAYPDGAVWPRELQTKESFVRKGMMRDLSEDAYPEYVEGDFFELKKLNIGSAQNYETYVPEPALKTLCEVYKFWIAFADIDGYRIDTVRHMGDGPTKYFAAAIHSYAHTLGKHNFYLIGEVSGDHAKRTLKRSKINAILGIDHVQEALWKVPLGKISPATWFSFFKNPATDAEVADDAHGFERNQIVTMIDDHDQTWKQHGKGRFFSDPDGNKAYAAALGLNLFTASIPCIYYGTEQGFDGNSLRFIGHGDSYADRFIRETMFGGSFGAFGSRNCHFFNETNPVYRTIADMAYLRRFEVALRRGSQHLRKTSTDGIHFKVPTVPEKTKAGEESTQGSVIAWSRIHDTTEVLCVMSTHDDVSESVLIEVDPRLHNASSVDKAGSTMKTLYPPNSDRTLKIIKLEGDRMAVQVKVAPRSFSVFK